MLPARRRCCSVDIGHRPPFDRSFIVFVAIFCVVGPSPSLATNKTNTFKQGLLDGIVSYHASYRILRWLNFFRAKRISRRFGLPRLRMVLPPGAPASFLERHGSSARVRSPTWSRCTSTT